MLLWIIAAAVGVLVVVVLLYKFFKTPKIDVVGYSMFCKTCGDRTNGMKCTRCEKEKWK
jgi:hypothetical protein|tara:strand:+ start:1118 stop:1294 length:177 start_codon:yes stop_codon:yes gene_type:complete